MTGKVLCTPKPSHKGQAGMGAQGGSSQTATWAPTHLRAPQALSEPSPLIVTLVAPREVLINGLLWKDWGLPAGCPENLGSLSQAGKHTLLLLGHLQCQLKGPSL